MPQSVLKDLDQHVFGKTEAEKKNYLAALILKHSHRLQIINEAYEALCTELVARIEDENYRGLISITNKYKAMLRDGMKNVKDECEIMLKLTGKKTSIVFTDKLLTKEQNQMKKLEATNARRLGQKNKASAPLAELSNMNKKFKFTVTPDEKKQSNQSRNPSRRTRKIDREIPSCRDDNDYPFVEEGKNSNTFHLSKKNLCYFLSLRLTQNSVRNSPTYTPSEKQYYICIRIMGKGQETFSNSCSKKTMCHFQQESTNVMLSLTETIRFFPNQIS